MNPYCVQFSFTEHLLNTCCVQSFAEHMGQMSKWCGGGGNPGGEDADQRGFMKSSSPEDKVGEKRPIQEREWP